MGENIHGGVGVNMGDVTSTEIMASVCWVQSTGCGTHVPSFWCSHIRDEGAEVQRRVVIPLV